MKDVIIAVDAMGGDRNTKVTIPAALKLLHRFPNVRLILVGDEKALEKRLRRARSPVRSRIEIQHASEIVGMDELPSQALRGKKDSSMRVSVNLVKEGRAQAAVSAGNTGALMVTARFVLKTLPGVDRPAIMANVPADNKLGYTRVLDLGANIDSTAEQLMQFAVMGSVVSHAVDKFDAPRVALLNIGEEEIKGNEQVKRTAELLQENAFVNYVGFAEGNDIFKDVAEVIVCDGFVGNVALKTMEGTARLIGKIIKRELTRSWFSKTLALFAMPILKIIMRKLDPAKYNGASLLGLKGIVVKSHGGTTVKGFVSALEHAVREVENDVIGQIQDRVSHLLENE